MKIFQMIFSNSWIKTIFFLVICFASTYFIIINFSDIFQQIFNWRNKNFWTSLAILIPMVFLIPTFLNILLFAKIVQIADNTNKTQKLLQKQIDLLQLILKK